MEEIVGARIQDVVRDKLFGLERLLKECEPEMSLQGALAFLDATKMILKVTEVYYEKRVKKIMQISDQSIRAKRLYDVSRIVLGKILLDIHEKLLPFLEPKRLEGIPTEILESTRALAAKFEDPDKIEISFVPQWNYQFSIRAYYDVTLNLIDSLRDDLPKLFVENVLKDIRQSKRPDSFVFVLYPWTEFQSLLLPSLVGHEIGHLKESKENLRELFLPETLDKPSVEALVRRLVQEPLYSSQSTTQSERTGTQLRLGFVYPEDILRQQVVQKCMGLTKNWVKEFVVDLLALHLFGPSYFFSFVELASIMGFDVEGGDTHPSTNWRLKTMIDELKQMGYLSDDFKNHNIRGLLGLWYHRLSNTVLVPQNQYHKIAYITIKEGLPRIHKDIKSLVKAFSYLPDRYDRELPPIVSLFEKGILPVQSWNQSNESFRNFDVRDIVNAAWRCTKREWTDSTSYLVRIIQPIVREHDTVCAS